MNQVDADALRVGLGDGSAELREVLLDAEALDEMLVRIQVLFFLFSPLLSKLLSSERRKRKKEKKEKKLIPPPPILLSSPKKNNNKQ